MSLTTSRNCLSEVGSVKVNARSESISASGSSGKVSGESIVPAGRMTDTSPMRETRPIAIGV